MVRTLTFQTMSGSANVVTWPRQDRSLGFVDTDCLLGTVPIISTQDWVFIRETFNHWSNGPVSSYTFATHQVFIPYDR